MLALINAHSKMKLTFSQWLKIVRGSAGVSQKQLADELGVKVQTVGNWEGERAVPKLTFDQTEKFCTLLNVTLGAAAKAFRGEVETND